jgi:chromosome segregation ATPase
MPDVNHSPEPQDEQESAGLPADQPASAEEPASAPRPGKFPPQVMAMAAVIVALLAILLILRLSGGGRTDGDAAPVANEEIYKLRAEIEAGRAEVNRQLTELGLPPRGGDSESVDEIAGRLRKDTDALIAITQRFQEMLVERDSNSGATSAELLRSEQTRQSLVEEVSRLHQQLDIARRADDSSSLRQQIEQLLTERDQLRADRDRVTESLAEAREKLAGFAGAPDAADYADLQRRFTETLNAKKFYEARLAEIDPLFENGGDE